MSNNFRVIAETFVGDNSVSKGAFPPTVLSLDKKTSNYIICANKVMLYQSYCFFLVALAVCFIDMNATGRIVDFEFKIKYLIFLAISWAGTCVLGMYLLHKNFVKKVVFESGQQQVTILKRGKATKTVKFSDVVRLQISNHPTAGYGLYLVSTIYKENVRSNLLIADGGFRALKKITGIAETLAPVIGTTVVKDLGYTKTKNIKK